jgi:hypothetical protein
LRQERVTAGTIMSGHRVFTFFGELSVVLAKGHAMAHLTG